MFLPQSRALEKQEKIRKNKIKPFCQATQTSFIKMFFLVFFCFLKAAAGVSHFF